MGEGHGYEVGLAGYSLARLRDRELLFLFPHNSFSWRTWRLGGSLVFILDDSEEKCLIPLKTRFYS